MAAALESYVSESVVFLVVAAALALLVSFAARRVGVGRALGPVQMLARLPLEARRAVYVVRVVDRVLIIGSSEAGLVKLGELGKDELGEPPGAPAETSFARLLSGAWRGPRSPAGASARAEAPPAPAWRSRGPDSEEGE